MHDPSWEAAWDERYGAAQSPTPAPERPRRERRSPRTRSVAVAAAILGVTISPFAVAAAGDALREGVRNGTTTRETEIISNIPASDGGKAGYSTRQSNLSSSGGGAIYGCRAEASTTNNPCLRVNNLSTGLAFEFQATSGTNGGTITVGTGGDTRRPFTTNATGVATGLNADRVDGLSADQVVAAARQGLSGKTTRWVVVNNAGQIESQSGGFTVVSRPGINGQAATNPNIYIDSGENLTDNGITGTIGIQNLNGGGGDADFAGDIAVSKCNIANVVNCAPNGTNTDNVFVVRALADNTDTASETRRFYVSIVE